jgi:hypothetical protein
MWELSMDPSKGRPSYEKLFELQYNLRKNRFSSEKQTSVPGESEEMKWIERGPGNVGGRTKGMMFDPNDSSSETAYAGGVSGGLFKNTSHKEFPTTFPFQTLLMIQIIHKYFMLELENRTPEPTLLEMAFGNPLTAEIHGLIYLVVNLKLKLHM